MNILVYQFLVKKKNIDLMMQALTVFTFTLCIWYVSFALINAYFKGDHALSTTVTHVISRGYW